MAARPLDRPGVDWVQWRALVVAGLKLDFRAPATATGGASGIQRLLALALMNLVIGAGLGAIALFVPDVFVSGSIALTVTMFLVALSVLMEFAVVVISPLDYDVLGYRPISSRTYFAARLANVIFYTTIIATAVALLPMAAYFFRRGFNPLLGLAAIAAFYTACITTTLAMVCIYVATAQRVHPARLRRVLTYVQLATSFVMYGGYFLLPQIFNPDALRGWSVAKTKWIALYPPAWFASYLDLAVGNRSALEVVPALAGIAALAALAYLASARLSLGFSEMLARQAARSEGSQEARRSWMPVRLLAGERRAVAMLVRAQFRHDQRFRLGVLSMVPLSVFYLLMGLREGPLSDPFVNPDFSGESMLLYFVVLFIPMMLMMAVGRSDAFAAAWVFYVSPARRADLVLAGKDLIVGFLLVPYLAALGAVLSYFFSSPVHAFLHVLVHGLIANLFLLAVVAIQPEIPFSKPVQKGQFTPGFFVVVVLGSIVQPLSARMLARSIYPEPLALAAVIAALLAAGVGGQAALRRRLERSTARMEFAA